MSSDTFRHSLEGQTSASGIQQHANGNNYTVPAGRADWIVKRKAEAARTGDTNMSQMHFARQGMITEEMAFVAQKEKLAARARPRSRSPRDA